jgi:hypothetical protein
MLQIQKPVQPPQNSYNSIRWGVPDFDIRSTTRHRNSSVWYHNTLQYFARRTDDGTKKQFMDACNELNNWFRQCATSRKVADPTPDGVTEILNWHNPSGHTMALGLTQPLTEMSTRNISWR